MNQVKLPVRLFVLLLLIACALGTAQCTRPAPSPEPIAEMPNPASVYCEEKGGKLEIRTDSSGGQYGICVFSDGSECEEWAYFRGECKPGDSLAPPEAAATATSAPATATSVPSDTAAPPTSTPVPTSTPQPTDTLAPTDTPAPTEPPTSEPPTPVPFTISTSQTELTIEGHLGANQYREFPFAGREGQPILVDLASTSEQVVFSIYGAESGQVLPGTALGATNWRGRLPATQQFMIRLFAPGVAANYQLVVRMPIEIRFEAGSTSASIQGSVGENTIVDYVARASEGQTAAIKISSLAGDVKLAIFGLEDDVRLLGFDEGEAEWQGTLPSTQDYLMRAIATGAEAAFTLDLSIE